MSEKTPLRFINLKIQNFKTLSALEIDANGQSIVLSGKNGAGKSSVIDALWLALQYSNCKGNVPRPVKDGENQATITVEFDKFIVERTIKNGKPTLHILPKGDFYFDGGQQALLDGFMGAVSIDPSDFLTLKPKDQITTVIEAFGIKFNLDEYSDKRKSSFEQRKHWNRQVRDLEPQVKSKMVPEERPQGVSVTELITRRDEAQSIERGNEAARNKIATISGRWREVDRKIRELQEELGQIRADGDAQKLIVDALEEPEDIAAISEQIANAEDTNRTVNEYESRRREFDNLSEQLTEAKSKASEFDNEITQLDQSKVDAIAGAQIPIDGLEITEDGILVDGLPLESRSDGERLLIALKIAIHANPDCPIIAVKRATLFDSATLAELYRAAGEAGAQLIVEHVTDDENLKWEIVEG